MIMTSTCSQDILVIYMEAKKDLIPITRYSPILIKELGKLCICETQQLVHHILLHLHS